MNELQALQTLGITLPSPAYIAGAVFFGLIGLAAFRSGRRAERPARKWLGVALRLIQDDLPYIPLSRRKLHWAMDKSVTLVQWPNDPLELRWVRMK